MKWQKEIFAIFFVKKNLFLVKNVQLIADCTIIYIFVAVFWLINCLSIIINE